MSRYAVIVDPLSTGQEYGPAFRAAGVEPVAVLSGAERNSLAPTWHPEHYSHVLHIDDGFDAITRRITELDPICVIPGSEPGVELYERLVTHVAPGSGNIPELAAARRDKWAMARALQTAGVPALRQICSADKKEIERWIAAENLGESTLVVKPPKSGGADEVHIVPPRERWQPLVDRLVGALNLTGVVNEAVLVQEYADGPEFLVDSYSVDGRHGLVDVCRYTKFRRGDRIGLYDRVDFLPPDDPQVGVVWPYVRAVLDAVGIRNGCGHAEVVLTTDGPRLLEVAERPAGGGHQFISKLATGDNHIERTVAHRVHGEFRSSYRLLQHLSGVFLSAPATGRFQNPLVFAGVTDLATCHTVHMPHQPGDQVVETLDLGTALGWVVLCGDDPAAIERDYQAVKAMERRIEIEPLVPAAA